MKVVNQIYNRGYYEGICTSDEDHPATYVIIDWVDINKIHADDTVKKVLYVGNFFLKNKGTYEEDVYACFNVIPTSEYERNALVAVKIDSI